MMSTSAVALCLLFLICCVSACTDTLYVGTDGAKLAISNDQGQSWRTVSPFGGQIYSIKAVDNNVFVGTDYGVAVSHDGGSSWLIKHLQNEPGCQTFVQSVFVDSTNRIYALIGGFGCARVAISSDNGDTWPTNVKLPSPPFGYPQDIYVDGERIYVATKSGLGFSDDQGATWTFKDQSSGLGVSYVQSVIGQGQTIYAGLAMDGGSVSMSQDGGQTWTTTNTTSTGLNNAVWSMYLREDTLYVATSGGGLSWSSDFTTWTRKTTVDGLASNQTRVVVVFGNNLYLGTSDCGLSISLDNGQTWNTRTMNDGLPSNTITAVFVQCV